MPEESVRPLERGLAVLRALAAAGPGQLRAGDLVRATGLARSTVDRVVTTLARLGYVRLRGQQLHLTPRLMELGNAYLAASGLTGEVAARTARLADELDESVSLAVPDGDGVRFVTQAARRRAMSVAFRIGDLLPPRALRSRRPLRGHLGRGAVGRLAGADGHRVGPGGLSRAAAGARARRGPGPRGTACAHARRSGWALDDQLIEPGLIAVAVPVRDTTGQVRYAISAVSHTSRHTAQGLAAAVLPRLRAEAEALAGLPGAAEPPDGGRASAREATGPTATGSVDPAADPATAKHELGPGFLQSLARGLAVLRALGGARGGGLPLTALAEATGLPRATARRCLRTLEAAGYAAHDGRLFRPLPRILELGHAALSGLTFAELAEPHLRDLADRVRQSASTTVLDGTDIRYVARAATVRVMSVHITVGTRFPAYATAMGRVLLAGLPEEEREHLLKAAPPRALTPRTVTDPDEQARVLATPPPRATPPSTRNWRTGCARWPCRSGTRPGGWSPP